TMTYASLEAFDAECEAFSIVLDGTGEDDYRCLSNCPPWTLHELVIHTAWSIRGPERFQLAPGAAARSAADYYRRPERHTSEYRMINVERTRSLSSDVPIEQVAARFRESWKRACATFAAQDPREVISIGDRAMTAEG